MYDLTAPVIAFFVIAAIATTVAVTVLVSVVADLLAGRGQVAVPIRLEQPLTSRRAA